MGGLLTAAASRGITHYIRSALHSCRPLTISQPHMPGRQTRQCPPLDARTNDGLVASGSWKFAIMTVRRIVRCMPRTDLDHTRSTACVGPITRLRLRAGSPDDTAECVCRKRQKNRHYSPPTHCTVFTLSIIRRCQRLRSRLNCKKTHFAGFMKIYINCKHQTLNIGCSC